MKTSIVSYYTVILHTPVLCVAIFGFSVVKNVLPGPSGGLLPTEDELELVRGEGLESLH